MAISVLVDSIHMVTRLLRELLKCIQKSSGADSLCVDHQAFSTETSGIGYIILLRQKIRPPVRIAVAARRAAFISNPNVGFHCRYNFADMSAISWLIRAVLK